MNAVNKKKAVAVVVPFYKDSLEPCEEFSLFHNARVLRERDLFLLAPKRLEDFVVSLSKRIENTQVRLVEDKFFDNSLKGNSRLMMNFDFYNSFCDYSYMLICHFDAFIFQDDLDLWVLKDYDYVGAPLFRNHHDQALEFRAGYNGGLCLRKIESCLKVISSSGLVYSRLDSIWRIGLNLREKIRDLMIHGLVYNYKFLKPIIHEDYFWSICAPDRFQWFKVAPLNEAVSFAFEVKPRLLFELNKNKYPMGIHAWWKYDKEYCFRLMFNFMSVNGFDAEQLDQLTQMEKQMCQSSIEIKALKLNYT